MRLLLVGDGISSFGTAISFVAIPLIATVTLKVSVFGVAALTVISNIAWLIVAVPAGLLLDRFRRRPILIACDLLRCGGMLVIPLEAAFGGLQIWHLYVVTLLVGLFSVVATVGAQAFIPQVAEPDDLIRANSILQGTQATAQVAGPGIGGLVVQAVGGPWAAFLDAVSYGVSALCIGSMSDRPEAAHAPEHRDRHDEKDDVWTGFRYLRRRPDLMLITLGGATANVALTLIEALSIVFLVRDVKVSDSAVGILLGVGSLGSVLGAAAAARITRRYGVRRTLQLALFVTSPFSIGLALTFGYASLPLFVLGSALPMIGVVLFSVNIATLVQQSTPDRILARVSAAIRTFTRGSLPFGGVLGAIIGTVWSPRIGLVVGAVLLSSAGLAMLLLGRANEEETC